MNKIVFAIFLVFLLVFLVCVVNIGKLSIKGILKVYFRNYFKNAEKEEDRKFSFLYLIFLGLMPYLLGVLLFFSFVDLFKSFDPDLLFQVNIILLTIFCLFIGMEYKKEGKEAVKKELLATLLVNVLLVVISSLILLIASSSLIDNEVTKNILYAVYYGLSFKVFSLFFYCLKRIFILSSPK